MAVEFALLAPILIMLLIGTITTGLSYSRALGITNAVREGARFGAVADASNGAWIGDVTTRVHDTQFDDPAGTETTICVQIAKVGTVPGAPTCNGVGPGVTATDLTEYQIPTTPTTSLPAGVCVVRVVAARNYVIQAPPLLPPIARKMVRGSVARYEKDSC